MEHYDLIFLPDESICINCKGSGGGNAEYPTREDPIKHSQMVLDKLSACFSKTDKGATEIRKVNDGYYVEFAGKRCFNLKSSSLGTSGLQLLNVRKEDEISYATVFISDDASVKLRSKIREYATKKTNKGKPKNNDLVSSIEDIKPADLKSLWTSYNAQIPENEPLWCEFWLFWEKAAKPTIEAMKANFHSICNERKLMASKSCMIYPEAVVFEACVSHDDICFLLGRISYTVAEIRRCIQPASFFVDRNHNQFKNTFSRLESRLQKPTSEDVAICLLDSGVYSEHVLLKPFIHKDGIMVAKTNVDPRDLEGHGTLMAGIALFNDLRPAFESSNPISSPCQLESVKVYRGNANNADSKDNTLDSFGIDFKNCVSMAEINRPLVKARIFCSAITEAPQPGEDNIGSLDGKHDSWSVAIDSVCSGSQEEDRPKRLFIESAGNTNVLEASKHARYPEKQFFSFIQSPGQAWNAITVGAYTALDKLDPSERNTRPVAPVGGISPTSSISLGWKGAPIKPEVLFEGGNYVEDFDSNYYQPASLNLVSTSSDSRELFDYMNGTSAASAQAANFCARLYEKYNGIHELWPETIRALLIHSASWTNAMRKEFLQNKANNETNYERILRTCGYGVPDFSKASSCLDNSATIVVQGKIQPFNSKKSQTEANASSMNAHIHELPWPSDLLSSLGAVNATLKATLSYFIEPNPNNRGSKYQSACLTFDVNRPTETKEDFIKRISGDNTKENSNQLHQTDKLWELGRNLRSLGSLHSDFIETSAANLASIKYLAVFPPKAGWWYDLSKKNITPSMRYSLVVTIETASLDTPIYKNVINKISIVT